MSSDEVVNVRYMVNDVAEAVDFYSRHFGFDVGISSRTQLPAALDE